MNAQQAVSLIRAHDAAVTRLVHAANSPRGRGTVTASKQVDGACKALFESLVGRKPTPDEVKEMNP